MAINAFDLDGVISIGIYPGPKDVIITGRSFEEKEETEAYLKILGINNSVYYNYVRFHEKSRLKSGKHKANMIEAFRVNDLLPDIKNCFEDDPIQLEIIRKECPYINVIHVYSNLVELENIRRPVE